MRRLLLFLGLLAMVSFCQGDIHKKILKIGLKSLKKSPIIPVLLPFPLPKHLPKLSHPHKSVWVSHGHVSHREAEKLAWKLEKEYHKYVNLVEGLNNKWPAQHKW